MSEKLENKNKRGRLTWASSLCSPAAASAGPAHWPLLCRLRPRQEDGRVPDARAHAPATSCLPARRWRHPRAPRTPPRPLHLPSLPLDPVPSSASLPRTPPSGARRHRRRTHGHRPPLASPMHPGAPPRPPLPPHRSTALRKPCIAAIAVVFYLGPAGHLRQIRRLRCLPELPEATVATPVSYSSIPPLPRTRSRTLAAFSPEPIAPRRRPWRGRGHSHRSSLLSPPACSPQPQEPKALNHSSSRALQRRSRETPSSGRRRGRCRAQLRPPHALSWVPLDAREHGLPPGALRVPNRSL